MSVPSSWPGRWKTLQKQARRRPVVMSCGSSPAVLQGEGGRGVERPLCGTLCPTRGPWPLAGPPGSGGQARAGPATSCRRWRAWLSAAPPCPGDRWAPPAAAPAGHSAMDGPGQRPLASERLQGLAYSLQDGCPGPDGSRGSPLAPAAGRAVPSTRPEGAPRGAGRPLTSMLCATSSWQKYTASHVRWSATAAWQASRTEARNLSFCASR